MQIPPVYMVVSLLKEAGLDIKKLREHLYGEFHHRGEDSNENEPTDKTKAIEFIKKYCVNLNELARVGKIDPVIGRLSEIQRVIQTIARRTKNNVVLLGNPGVGKTAIVEGLAYNIVHGKVPKIMQKSTIWSLDIGSLVAGTRFRGDFEERMNFLLKAFSLIEDEDPILFIDEIHMIVDAGSGNKGSLDISNLLKPVLARGRLRCIGSTTDKDWRQYFEKDRALVRRFKKLQIDEPSIEDAKLILKGLRSLYEKFHNVKYTDEALELAVELTAKYIEGQLPDKAIDVIDEAGSHQRIRDDGSKETIVGSDIELEISKIAKIPLKDINKTDSDKLICLDTDLKSVVFGQDKAVDHLVNSVLIGRAGLREINKPEGCFLFVGPTGVGKTELARQLAKTLGIPLIKFDMSEYMEKHSISKFIGSPPGYVGFGDGGAGNGLLINAIDKTPSCVLLLDEIEKSHFDIFNILLQVMDDAVLTNSEGKSVNFRNVIIIMTSNVGVCGTEKNQLGFVQNDIEIDESLIKSVFSPEFRNRLDAIIRFEFLNKVSMNRIVERFMEELGIALKVHGVTIEITNEAKKWLVSRGYDVVYGARPLRRLISEKIKLPLSKMILFGSLKNGGVVKVSIENNEIEVCDSMLSGFYNET